MNRCYWDASALGKRYAAEVGSVLVNHGFAVACSRGSYVLALGIGEVFSVLVRKYNGGALNRTQLGSAIALLRQDLSADGGLGLENPQILTVIKSWELIERHGVNATDALVLQSALEIAASLRQAGDNLILFSSDIRLIRAATAEGLASFNPEFGSESQLDALLAV